MMLRSSLLWLDSADQARFNGDLPGFVGACALELAKQLMTVLALLVVDMEQEVFGAREGCHSLGQQMVHLLEEDSSRSVSSLD